MTDYLGAGIGYRRVHHADLIASEDDNAPKPSVLEIIPGHFFADPSRLEELASRYPIVFHEVSLSIGTEDAGAPSHAISRDLTTRIAELVAVAKPKFVSDHLALTRSPSGIDMGHLCPVWLTKEALASIGDRVRALQDVFGLPVALENISLPFVIPEGDMDEPTFFHELCDRTGCGMLLDLTNLFVNAENFDFSAVETLSRYPLSSVWQVHLAGTYVHRGVRIDSHSKPVERESFALLRELKKHKAPLVTIIVERDEEIPPLSELVMEASRADALWRGDERTEY